jgi:flagellar assembly protein FliH
MAGRKVVIGDYMVDRDAENQAEQFLKDACPDVTIVTTRDGKKQVPLQDLIILGRRLRAEKDAACAQSFADGRQTGHAAGLDEGRREARQVVASLSGLIADVTAQRETLLAEAKERVLDLVLKISEKLTFTASLADPGLTVSIISGAIDHLLDKSKIKIKVHPDHLPEVEQHIDRFRGANTSVKEIAIEPDSRVRFGGCFIETPSGDIDARLESMYEVIKQALLDAEDARG